MLSNLVVWRAAALLFCSTVAPAANPLFENSDFESGDLAPWTAKGDAFVHQPTKGDNSTARHREPSLHEGEFWIGGFEKHTARSGQPGDIHTDDAVGELVSPAFEIKEKYISFLVSGGAQPGKLGVKLLCDGREIDLATGVDGESMTRVNADVADFFGKQACLVVYDLSRGQWGHINVDGFVASSEQLPDKSKEFALYPALKAEDYSDIDYSEPLRPQFHFSSGRNWLNDPNGMVFDGEKYHLFFQHNPAAPVWGNMTWGHATSPDMIHWTQQPHALLPYRVDGRTGTIFSGTAVIDHNNSLGVQKGSQKTLCAFFTFAAEPKFYQAMAYSTDGGESWTYWNEGRTVVPHQGFDNGERDPKVFWHEPSKQWVMTLWVQSNPGRVRFFTSKNLTDWEFASDLMRGWAFECMDVVFYPTNDGGEKAVIYDASFDYEVGTFDGKEFHTEAGPFVPGGGNFYAAQTFNNSPDGRVVQIGWMRGGPNTAEKYGLPYNQQMAFPCELTLRDVKGVPRLFAWPIKEIESLVEATHEQGPAALDEKGFDVFNGERLDLADIEISFDPGDAETVNFDLGKARLWYKGASHELWMSGVNDGGDRVDTLMLRDLAPRDGVVKLRLLVDRLSVEAFAFGGEQFYAGYYVPLDEAGGAVVRASGGGASIHSAKARQLRSAWSR